MTKSMLKYQNRLLFAFRGGAILFYVASAFCLNAVVYIEYALAENFIIDVSLLYVSLRLTGRRASLPLILISGGVGAAAAVIYPLFSFPPAIKILLKILTGALMCVIASPKKPVFVCAAFFFISFAVGGGITALFSLPFAEENNGEYTLFSLPAPLVVCAACAFCAAAVFLANRLYSRARIIKSSVPCLIQNGGAAVKARALIDSGNNFYYKGNPVSMVSSRLAVKLLGDIPARSPIYEAEINTLTGTGKIKIIKAELLTIYFSDGEHRINGAYLGISGALNKGEYSVVLNGAYIGKEVR